MSECCTAATARVRQSASIRSAHAKTCLRGPHRGVSGVTQGGCGVLVLHRREGQGGQVALKWVRARGRMTRKCGVRGGSGMRHQAPSGSHVQLAPKLVSRPRLPARGLPFPDSLISPVPSDITLCARGKCPPGRGVCPTFAGSQSWLPLRVDHGFRIEINGAMENPGSPGTASRIRVQGRH